MDWETGILGTLSLAVVVVVLAAGASGKWSVELNPIFFGSWNFFLHIAAQKQKMLQGRKKQREHRHSLAGQGMPFYILMIASNQKANEKAIWFIISKSFVVKTE